MTSTHAQVQFAAEFVTLMVAASGLALAVLRSEPNRGARRRPGIRLLVAVGCLITGTAAFLHGSLLVSESPPVALSVARLVGAALLGFWVLAWPGGRGSGLLLRGGVGCWAAAAVAELAQASNWVVDVVLVAGSVGIGLALLANSRHSIAARVAASGAATVLLVVLVLAVALSAVISSSLQRDALNRLNSRAQTESAQVGDTVNAAGKDARFIAAYLQAYFNTANPNPLITFASSSAVPARQAIQSVLRLVAAYYPVGGFAYANPRGSNLAVTLGIDPTFAGQLARDPTFAHLPCNGQQPGTVFVSPASAAAAAAYPVCLSGTNQVLGTVITITPLGAAYLDTRLPIDRSVALALVTPQSVLATAGPQPPRPTLVAFAGQPDHTAARGSNFLAAVPVTVAHSSPPLAVVLSTPTTTVVSTQNQLYRTLFLIALGGTVLALGLAAFTGDRITAGIRRLTQVADRIQGGQTSERSYIAGDDEVATLGSTFDSMIDSVEE
ncbi:MAG TPA: HAMP domain-containing protein, partial [Acidimicrobiales bacterium]